MGGTLRTKKIEVSVIDSCLLLLLIEKISKYEQNIVKKIFDLIFYEANEKNSFLPHKEYKWVMTKNPNYINNINIKNLFIFNDKIKVIHKNITVEHLELPNNIEIITSKIDVTSINLKNLEMFETETFNNSKIRSITFNENIRSIPNRAFSGSYLEIINFKLNNNIIKIGEYAFSNTNIKNINLPDNILYIGKYAFSLNNKLESVSLPRGLTYLFDNLFYACVNLKTISLPKQFSGENYKKLLEKMIIDSGSSAKIIFRD